MKKLIMLSLLLNSYAYADSHFNLYEENDYFKIIGKNSDREYTQGLKFSYNTDDDSGSHSYSLGQNIYTPGNKQNTDPQNDQRPYAAWAYGEYKKFIDIDEGTLNVLTLDVGIVGPHAYGEQTQNGVHKWLGQKSAKGWGNQLHDELGVIASYEKRHRTNRYTLGSVETDNILTAGGNLGNVFSQMFIGTTLRVGHNIPNNFGPDIIYPRISLVPDSPFSYYLFSGLRGRVVGRNIFLDGNTFRDSQSVDKNNFVGEVNLGLGLGYDAYTLIYTYTAQTNEYKGQTSSAFGSLNFGVNW